MSNLLSTDSVKVLYPLLIISCDEVNSLSAVILEPVSTVMSNVDASPFVNVIVFRFTEAVVNKLPVSTGSALRANEAVVANDDDIEVLLFSACEELTA